MGGGYYSVNFVDDLLVIFFMLVVINYIWYLLVEFL